MFGLGLGISLKAKIFGLGLAAGNVDLAIQGQVQGGKVLTRPYFVALLTSLALAWSVSGAEPERSGEAESRVSERSGKRESEKTSGRQTIAAIGCRDDIASLISVLRILGVFLLD